ncbi:hypothetical protein [Streptomyces coelicoflavus]|uniref:hypothetical protein n=1 Tax=Streptomyces coelicoflavus TaxID=285562 RepID=UPI00363D50A5
MKQILHGPVRSERRSRVPGRQVFVLSRWMSVTVVALLLATVADARQDTSRDAAPTLLTASASTGRVVQQPVPQVVVDRYHLDTGFYAKYVQGPTDVNTGLSVAVLGSSAVQNDTLLKAARQLDALSRTYPYYPVNELARRNVRVVLVARGERMSSIPEVRAAYGSSLDDRYWAGMGATDHLPISVGTEANLMDDQGGENVFAHEYGHTVAEMALRRIDPAFGNDLDTAFQQARTASRWNNTYAGTNAAEYWAEGLQSYFGINREGPVGGDGVHNAINTRVELQSYDPPLFKLLDRVYHGIALPA